MSSPSSSTSPASDADGIISCIRLRIRRKVDLPQPDGPMRAVTCPAAMSSDTRSSTWWVPNHAEISCASSPANEADESKADAVDSRPAGSQPRTQPTARPAGRRRLGVAGPDEVTIGVTVDDRVVRPGRRPGVRRRQVDAAVGLVVVRRQGRGSDRRSEVHLDPVAVLVVLGPGPVGLVGHHGGRVVPVLAQVLVLDRARIGRAARCPRGSGTAGLGPRPGQHLAELGHVAGQHGDTVVAHPGDRDDRPRLVAAVMRRLEVLEEPLPFEITVVRHQALGRDDDRGGVHLDHRRVGAARIAVHELDDGATDERGALDLGPDEAGIGLGRFEIGHRRLLDRHNRFGRRRAASLDTNRPTSISGGRNTTHALARLQRCQAQIAAATSRIRSSSHSTRA